jgi:hypothetical protein
MKSAIYSFVAISDKSMVASVKVARFIRDELQLELTHDARTLAKDLDVLIIVNGAYAFAKHLQELHDAILGAGRIVWVQQDYSIVPPINNGQAQSPFRKAFVERREQGKPHLDFWTTCAKESTATPLSTLINWNCLSMLQKPLTPFATHDDVAYYGSYRGGRRRAFDRFFKNPLVKMIISSPSKRFQEIYSSTNVRHVGVQDDLLKWLGERAMGLYLEDEKSHREYHSPPNRFYEMLSAGVPMVFEEGAGPTLRRMNYNPAEYTVSKSLDIFRKLEQRDRISKEQREKWWGIASAERYMLTDKLKSAWLKQGEII